MIYNDITELIGNTPMLKLSRFVKAYESDALLYGKLEFLNPGGSTKDRAALCMLNEAQKRGTIREGATIIEPTSGNTGIGLALVAAARGYKVIIVLPDTMSIERRKMLAAYGAELVLTEGSLGMKGAIEKAEELNRQIPGSMILGQFDNADNALSHELTTGPEIYEDMEGDIDYLVVAIGTGGTITGCSHYLKNKKPSIKVIGVEPASSPLLSKGYSGTHNIQGIGANFIPKVLDTKCYDEVICVCEEDAYRAGRILGKSEGVLCGISSGAALCAALELSKRPECKGKKIVVLLPDSGDRYFSTPMFTTN